MPSVASRSSLFSSAPSAPQLPTATQLIPNAPNPIAQLLGVTSLAPSQSLPDAAPAIILSAVPTQLVPVQPAAALTTPILPALMPGPIASTLAQGPSLPLAGSEGPSGTPSLQIVALSPAPAPASLPLVAPAGAPLATTQPVVQSPNLFGQLAPTLLATPSTLLPTTLSAQLLTPILPAPIFSPAASILLAPTAPLTPSFPSLVPAPSNTVALGLLAFSSPIPTPTSSPSSGAALINGAALLSVAEAVTSSLIPLLNVPTTTSISLVGIPSSSPAVFPIQPSSSIVVTDPGILGVSPAAFSIPQSLASPRPLIVTVPLEGNPLLAAVPTPLEATPFIATPLPLATPTPLPVAVTQLNVNPLTLAPALPTLNQPAVGNNVVDPASPVSTVESEVPWWVITEFLEPHGLPPPPIFATPPPLALPALPAVQEPSLPAPSVPGPLLGLTSTNTLLDDLPVEYTVPQVIESGTVVDKVFTWSLYSDGSAQVNGTFLSPETGPIQAYLSDGTRIGMDSAGLYIGWEHRVPYPAEFLQIIRGYLLPPPQLFL
ncbi:hypothetical protein E8E12_005958 [Didymella heteroderae]|uniref:Uncharacterized protein n=1 Tax=Didymella heteroderae TaxID=1769908 RepID=A0A9P4WQF9_9PLEO|nr:hypothetical protein E8E12_005958 [Didymella heteroderae]